MLATAPGTSVSHLPAESKSKRPNPDFEISATRRRCEYRIRVVKDTGLSMGARLAYVALDDMAGLRGVAWPKQETLGRMLGASARQAGRWIAALVRAGHVDADRRQRCDLYRLAWVGADGDRTFVAGDRTTVSDQAAPFLIEPEKLEPEVSSSSDVEVTTTAAVEAIGAAAESYAVVDDVWAGDMMAACRRVAADVTPDEVAELVHVKGHMASGMKNPGGFLLTAVANLCRGGRFQRWRAGRARAVEERQRAELARVAADARMRVEMARIAEDPGADEWERRLAREYLGIGAGLGAEDGLSRL